MNFICMFINHFHVNRCLCTQPRFETEVWSNSEMAYCMEPIVYSSQFNSLSYVTMIVKRKINKNLNRGFKKSILFEYQCIQHESTYWGHYFLRLLLETGPLFYEAIRAICRAKAVPSFLSYFKTLSIGRVSEIEPSTPRSQWNFTLLCVSLSIFQDWNMVQPIPTANGDH